MRWNLVFVSMVLATIAGCATPGGGGSSPFVIVLPNGYLIDRDRSSNTRIVKRSGAVVVQGPIAAYTVVRNVVTGYVGEPPPDTAAKYFVLDTASGKVDSHLDTVAWNNRLTALGATASPVITAPILPK